MGVSLLRTAQSLLTGRTILGRKKSLVHLFNSKVAVPRGCLQFVIVVFPDHTHLLFLHVYDETPNLVNFVLLSFTELYLQQIMHVSC